MPLTKPIPHLGRRVKQLREAAGLSQQALAAAAGLSISVVTQLEQGAKADPRVSTAAALAAALGVTMDELLATASEEPVAKRRSERIDSPAARFRRNTP
jgi:transcriptional regulator with XRE-family HTH domain